MDTKKLILYFVLALLGVGLWNVWLKDNPPESVKQAQQLSQVQKTPQKEPSTGYVPPSYSPGASAPHAKKGLKPVPEAAIQKGQQFNVKTDVLDIAISKLGGNIVSAKLLKYPLALKSPDAEQILTSDLEKIYVAQSGLTNSSKGDALKDISFYTAQNNYVLQPGQEKLKVILTGRTKNGLDVTKTYIFERDRYAIELTQNVKNSSNKTWNGSFYNQITRRNVPVAKAAFHSRSYTGAAISSPGKPYEKRTFKKLDENNISQNIRNGWIAMQQPYFLTAWVPQKNITNHYYSHAYNNIRGVKNKVFTLGYVSPQMALAPTDEATSQSSLYVGPEIAKRLNKLAEGLSLTINYGWLWPVSEVIFWVMQKIFSLLGNWGWSIVIVTLLIKLIFYKLSEKSYRSMVRMREIQPRLAALKEKHGDDKQAFSKATMEFYRKEKVNPLGGCLPMVVQIPVFFALYYVLIESVQLRQAPFLFWIQDLAIKDPYYVLPILMGVSMLIQYKLSPPPPDPTQAKVMMFLPVIFTIFFLSFPAGLVLYWLVNNVASLLQQWYVMKTYNPKAHSKKKKKSRLLSFIKNKST